MGLRVRVLASGSAGNLTLVEGPGGRLLIEFGLSEREGSRRLRAAGVEPGAIDALIVSHEHADHVGGAERYARRHGVPIFTTRGTARAAGLTEDGLPGLVLIEAGTSFEAAGMRVHPFSVPHDAADSVAFVVECEGARLGYATDLGFPTALAMERLRGCELLVIEANHDLGMLRSGPYPAHVKQRVMGRHGHLSNEQAADLLAETVTAATRAVFLAHLSRKNNDAALAMGAGRDALERAGRPSARLELTFQDLMSGAVDV